MTDNDFGRLMERLKQRDMSALEEIYREYSGYVYRCVRYLVDSNEDAEDVASDVFVRLYEKAERYKDGYSHKAYLAKIARNMTVDFLRKRGREIPSDEMPEEVCESQESNIIRQMDVESMMNTLPVAQKEILHLKFFGGLTLEQIAKVLGMPPGTVNWNFSKAKENLRRYGYEV